MGRLLPRPTHRPRFRGKSRDTSMLLWDRPQVRGHPPPALPADRRLLIRQRVQPVQNIQVDVLP